VPVWGSCWGLQLAVVALGGSVRRNPRGRELSIARAITVTDTGRAHPLLASRPAVFDALCSHLDEIETLPPNSRVLAANEVSAVQAIAAQTSGRGGFHGTRPPRREGRRAQLGVMRWGLVPYWAKDLKVGFA